MTNRDNYLKYAAVFLTLLGGIIRLSLSSKMQVMNVDAIGSLERGITISEYFDTLPGFWTPLYPLLCILINYVIGDIELSGKAVSILAGTGLVFVIFLLVRKLYGDTAALISAIMIAFYPVMIYYSTFTTPEMTYICFLYLSIIYFVVWVRKQAPWLAVLMGFFAAAAYLTRQEGFLLVVQIGFMGLLVIFYNAWRNKIAFGHPVISLMVFLIAFVVLTLPYLVFLKHEVGHWTISTGGGGALERTMYNVESKVWSLTGDKKRIHGYFHNDYVDITLLEALKTNPQKIAEKWKHNSKYLVTSILPKLFLHKYILIMFTIMIGIALACKRRDMKKHLMLLFLLSPMIITPLYVIELRTQIYIIPIVLILSSVTLGSLSDVLFNRYKITKVFSSPLGIILVCVFMIFLTIIYYKILEPRVAQKGSYGVEQKEAGLWLGDSALPPGTVMARKPWVAYYSENENLPLPLASYEDILYYARVNGGRYFVIDDLVTVQLRPALSFLLNESPKDLELIYDNRKGSGRRVRIFVIKESSGF